MVGGRRHGVERRKVERKKRSGKKKEMEGDVGCGDTTQECTRKNKSQC